MTNQTIDGVPRALLGNISVYLADSPNAIMRARAKELRALLDAPAVEVRDKCGVQMVDCPECSHQWDHFFECGNGPANPKPTGLSQGWNLTRKNDGFVVGHQSVAYPPDEKAIERAERDGYVWVPFLVPAAQPQGEPVAWMDPRSPEMHATISNEVKQHNLKFGGAPSAAVNGYSIPLYAEQPAPVAVVGFDPGSPGGDLCCEVECVVQSDGKLRIDKITHIESSGSYWQAYNNVFKTWSDCTQEEAQQFKRRGFFIRRIDLEAQP